MTSVRGLSADALTFAYPRQTPIFEAWDCHFSPGEVTAIVGRSGQGKSTLLYLLGLTMRPTSGAITLNGEDVSSLPDRERARIRAHEYGFVFQDASLNPRRSVLDNILETCVYRGERPSERRATALELMADFGVNSRPDAFPGQLSGGQAQRIALCRALVHNPGLILADEPTGNLDTDSADVVFAALQRRAHKTGCVVILVTHDIRLAASCDREVRLS